MASIETYAAGPSRPKKIKYDQKKSLTDEELLKLLEESDCDSDVDINFDDASSDDNYVPNEVESDDQDDTVFSFQQERIFGHQNENTQQWEELPTTMKLFPFSKREQFLIPLEDRTPIDFFRTLLTDEFLQLVVDETNNYALEVYLAPSTKEKSRIVNWRDVTVNELLVFLGLLLHMGNIKLSRLQDYWKQDPLYNISIFGKCMSRNRFLLIMRCLHFTRNPDENEPVPEDRLYKVRNIINGFNQRMGDVFYPVREHSLDESMVLWRGRLTFRQYIKNKRHRYGIKLYMLTDSKGMILKFMVYTGMLDDSGGKGHADKVVMKLMEDKLNVGHSVYMDNFYNSYGLAKKLLDNKTHCTGTLRIDRKNNPPDVKEAKLKKGELIGRYSDGIMIGKWKDKRDVSYISTQFENKLVDCTNRRGQVKQKPQPIIYYNQFMSGIDRQDQMLSYYPCERKTIRWPTKIVIHIIQMMLINAFHLFNRFSGTRMTLYDFRHSVIRKLLPTLDADPKTTHGESEHIVEVRQDKTTSGKIKRKPCKSCTEQGRRKDSIYICTKCPNSPGYCLDCSNIVHK